MNRSSIDNSVIAGLILLFIMAVTGSVLAKEKPLRTIKVKLVADQHFACQTEWERKAARQLLDIAGEVNEILHVNFEIVGYELWEHDNEGDLYRLTSQMIKEINRGEAEILVGFTFESCPDDGVATHTSGVTIPYRGMLIKTYHARCPRNAFIPYVMIHEMVHILGGVHVYDGSLMSPVFSDTINLYLDPLNQKIVRFTKNIDFNRGYAALDERTLEKLAGLYERAFAAGNRETVMLNELGAMYLILQKNEPARAVLELALKQDSTFSRIWMQLAENLRRSESIEAAISILETALDYADDLGVVYSRLAQLYFDRGDKKSSFRYAVLAEKHGGGVDSVLWNNLESMPEGKKD